MPSNEIALVAFLYGGLTGWLGMAMAFYLQYIRRPPAEKGTNFAIFSAGFGLLMLATEAFWLVPSATTSFMVRLAGYIMLSITELALVATAVGYHPVQDVENWMFEDPKFTRYNKVAADDDDESTGYSSDDIHP